MRLSLLGLVTLSALPAEAERRSRYRLLKDDGKEALWRLAACRGGHADSCAPR